MEAIYALVEYGKVTLKKEKVPEPGYGKVLVEAICTAMSPGTEHGIMTGNEWPLPQKIGYAMLGEVIEVGKGVKTLKKGDYVVATAQHQSHVILDENICTPCPKDIDVEQAVFFNLAHTAMFGVRRSQIQLGEPILVLGQGMVGALAAQLAKISGATPLIVTDVDDSRLEVAKSVGIQYAINTAKDQDKLNKLLKKVGGVCAVLEATGHPECLQQAAEYVRERGRIMILSSIYGNETMNLKTMFMKGATLIGGYINSKPYSLKRYDLTVDLETWPNWPPKLVETPSRFVSSDIWTSDEDMRTVLNLIRYGSLNIKPLITHKFTSDQLPEAYEHVWNQDPALMGALIRWK